jgi:transcriptional regulator of acetoin/glycerol metabolism
VFFDEVADLPEAVQGKLLRVLDTREIVPLGDPVVSFEAQVIAACQEPLAELVEKGRFRRDLAARLSGLVIEVPLLSDRRSDIPSLFHTFLLEHSGGTTPRVSAKLYESLCLYSWPGNVRELELLARQLLALRGMEPLLRRSHLPEALRTAESDEGVSDVSPEDKNRSDAESLASALQRARGNVKAAAAMAGISRQRAYRLIEKQDLRHMVSSTREQGTDGEGERDT